jgi:pimeloyl-ACP methyl ester carboxylesterase
MYGWQSVSYRILNLGAARICGGGVIMTRAARLICMAMMLSAGLSAPARANDATVVSVPTPRGVTQAFILIKPDHPVASVILFAGGHGALGLKSASSMTWGAANFMVRTRDDFAGHNFMVAVVDAPSDHQQGMNAVFRMSNSHAGDIGAVAAYLKKQAAVPVWLVGTSMGTFSAAGGAIATAGIDGLVLTSTITRSMPQWDIAKSLPEGVAGMALEQVKVPTLIVSHRKDACKASPPAKAPDLKMRLSKASKVEVAILDGGRPPQSEPCEAKAPHGYFGVEKEAVDAIARFVSENSKG